MMTRIKLVIKLSLRCPKSGFSLNEMMMKKPKVLADLWVLLMMFRGWQEILPKHIIVIVRG